MNYARPPKFNSQAVLDIFLSGLGAKKGWVHVERSAARCTNFGSRNWKDCVRVEHPKESIERVRVAICELSSSAFHAAAKAIKQIRTMDFIMNRVVPFTKGKGRMNRYTSSPCEGSLFISIALT